jgi:hypothetical protein
MSKKESGCLSFLFFCSRDKSKGKRHSTPENEKKEMNEKGTQTYHLVQRRTDPAGVNYMIHKSTIAVRDSNGFILQGPKEKLVIDNQKNDLNHENKQKNLPGNEDLQNDKKNLGKVCSSDLPKSSLSPFRISNDNHKPKIVAITPRVISGRYLSSVKSFKGKSNEDEN